MVFVDLTLFFMGQSPRLEVVSLVGSLLCFPESLPHLPVLQPKANGFFLVSCREIKVRNYISTPVSYCANKPLLFSSTLFQEHIVALIIKSAKREVTSVGRCVAISSLALYVYCQLTHDTGHPKVREALTILSAVLKVCWDCFLLFCF